MDSEARKKSNCNVRPQDNQLMSKYRILSFKPQLRLEWRGRDGQNETEQPDHSANLGDSITASTQIRFSVHTTSRAGRRATSISSSIASQIALATRTLHHARPGRPRHCDRCR